MATGKPSASESAQPNRTQTNNNSGHSFTMHTSGNPQKRMCPHGKASYSRRLSPCRDPSPVLNTPPPHGSKCYVPSQGQSGRLSPQEHHWHTHPALLPAHWIRQQQEYREHALAIMLSCDPPLAVQAFLVTRHREWRLNDLPVWRALELAPNPANINFHRTYLPALLGLTIRLAQLQHPPIHNDPLWSRTLAAQETHHGHWEAICQRINSTQPDADEQQFRALFHNAHQRQPTEADVPTWQSLVLTETIPKGDTNHTTGKWRTTSNIRHHQP